MRAVPFQGIYATASAAFPNSIGPVDIVTAAASNLWFRLDGAISG